MAESIIIIDSSEIREGKLEGLKEGMKELVEFVKANEPRMIAYNIYFNEKNTRITVLQIHPDSESAELHMKVAASRFSKFVEFIKMMRIDIYGTPSHDVLERLLAKAHMLGSKTVVVHNIHTGFTRF